MVLLGIKIIDPTPDWPPVKVDGIFDFDRLPFWTGHNLLYRIVVFLFPCHRKPSITQNGVSNYY